MTSNKSLSRRRFLGTAAAVGAVSLTTSWTNLAFAQAAMKQRLVVILLRGGMDGLSLFPPIGDRPYAAIRGPLAITDPIELNNFYGLHPAADALLPFWARGELAVFPASGTSYDGTNHVEAQQILDGGTAGQQTGWLNRALQAIGGTPAIAVGQRVPRILAGPATVNNWRPERTGFIEGFRERLRFINDGDLTLAHATSLMLRQQTDDQQTLPEDDRAVPHNLPNSFDIATLAPFIGRELSADDGPRIAVLESAGWDSHHRQGAVTGKQARRFATLATTLEGLAASMGPVWKDTVIVVASEFGRSLRPNEWKGTDNGGATATLVLGDAVKGGRFLGKWPGLTSASNASGGLIKTIDTRAIFKAVLAQHLKIGTAQINTSIFPGSSSIPPVSGLF